MTLSIQDLGALGELLGSVAVLVTLGYLALQTRQNTMAIAAQLDAAAIGVTQNVQLSAATSKDLAEVLAADSAGDVSAAEIQRFWYWSAVLHSFQWQFHQARRGLLPTFHEVEHGLAGSVRALFGSTRSFGVFWTSTRSAFSPEFVAWVEEQRSAAS